MKINFTFYLILSLTILIVSLKVREESLYVDDMNSAMKRLEHGRNYSETITKGKVDFEYEEGKGVYCKAKKDLFPNEFVFDIENKFIMCSFDIYPYKFEIYQAVNQFLSKKYGRDHNTIMINTPFYSFAFSLMYLDFNNKTYIEEHLKATQKDYYIPTHR